MDNVSVAIAFSAGLLSFLSPCVLPLVPAYLSYLTGTAASEITEREAKRNLILKALGFVFGFSVIFIIMGASASSLGQLFAENRYLLKKIGGIIIVLMGLHMTGIFKIKSLYREKRLFSLAEKNRGLGSIFIGMAFATGWTPCIGPILSSILIYASSLETVRHGVILLSVYSLGLAVPLLLTALAINRFASYFKKFSRYLPVISVVSGILLIITGMLIFTDKLLILSSYLDFINF